MKKVRKTLAIFSTGLTIILGAFVWIMLGAGEKNGSTSLLVSLLLIVGVAVAAQVIYALKGQIFEFDGRLAKREVLFSIICFQIVMQFSFGFALYAINQTELQNDGFDSAYAHFTALQQSAAGNDISGYQALDLAKDIPEQVERVFLATDGRNYDPSNYYRFPISDGMLLMSKSQSFINNNLRDFALSLLMSLIVSVLLMGEIVLLAIKLIERRNMVAVSETPVKPPPLHPAGYLRQIAFLFYFTGYLSVSFIPIMARDFAASNPQADFIAGLPYSVEAMSSCAAIFLTMRVFTKKGWKPSYLLGAGFYILGLTASAISPDVYTFIASRALIGIGYGFCWMTLRNVASLSGDKAQNFADLTSGIYAGIMCSVPFGAVLADMAGYRVVLITSALLSIAVIIFTMRFSNVIISIEAAESRAKSRLLPRDIGILAVFLALVVIPTGITDSFRAYLLPLYINDLDMPTTYVGRVSFVYNLCLVYISSTLMLKAVRRYLNRVLLQNILHMLIISAALFITAYLGGFVAILIAGALLGSADGFGFSVQNSYILSTSAASKIGTVRLLTWISLFKKFVAMFAPFMFGLFIINGFGGLSLMAALFIVLAALAVIIITLLQRNDKTDQRSDKII